MWWDSCGAGKRPASAPRPLSPLPPTPFPTGPVHGAWEPSLALASLCHPGSPARPRRSPTTSQGGALCPGAAEGQRANRQRRAAASSGSLALTREPGGRREVSASVGSSGLVETPPVEWGPQDADPRFSEKSPPRWEAREKRWDPTGSHLLEEMVRG